MVKISLSKLEPYVLEDQLFLYDVLKYRWTIFDTVHPKYQTDPVLPSFEQHVNHINSDKHKIFYKINYGDIPIGSVSLNFKDESSTFVIPSELKKALKKYKNEKREHEEFQISAVIHMLMCEKHPEIEVFYARANPNNKLSVRALLENGYEHIESLFALKTNNGKSKLDKHKSFYDKSV
jgi:hypothetical protein